MLVSQKQNITFRIISYLSCVYIYLLAGCVLLSYFTYSGVSKSFCITINVLDILVVILNNF